MPSNQTKILLLMTMVSGVLLSVSFNSWFSVSMGLEMNLMSFIRWCKNLSSMYTTQKNRWNTLLYKY